MAFEEIECYTEPNTGVRMPTELSLWDGRKVMSLGIGLRVMKFAIIKVKVYAISFYIDEETLLREGYDCWKKQETPKVIVFELVRTITSKDFSGALMRSQRPRMRGEEHFVDQMEHPMGDRTLHKGTRGITVCMPDGVAMGEACIDAKGNVTFPVPGIHVASPRLCFNLFDVYIGTGEFVQQAKEMWMANAKKMHKTGKKIKF